MGSWKISYEIKNVDLNIPETLIDNVAFRIRDPKQIVGTVTIDSDNEEKAILEARQIIDNAVNKLCYIYDREFSIITNGVYIVDLANPSVERVMSDFVLMRDVGMDLVQDTRFSKLKFLNPNKQEIARKVFALYRIALNSDNPFKAIDSYFSCIQAVLNDETNPISPDRDLKKGIRSILSKRIKNFDEQEFYNKFGRCYGKWRSNSTHGDLDVSDHKFKEQAENDLHEVRKWAWEILDEFLTKNEKQ